MEKIIILLVVFFYTESSTNEAVSNVLFIVIYAISSFCLFILIVLFTSLVVNCYVCVKYKRSRGGSSDAGKSSDHLQLNNPTHQTYDIAASSVISSKTQEVDMTENVAYGPLRSTQL